MKKKKAKAAKKKPAGPGNKSSAGGQTEPVKKNVQEVRSSVDTPRTDKKNIGGGRQPTPDGTSSRRLPSGENPATPDQSPPVPPVASPLKPKPRPRVLDGKSIRFKTGCGNIYVTITEDQDGNPFELFTQIGKAGGCAASQTESIGRLASLALRSGLPLPLIMEQLRGIACHEPAIDNGKKVLSCADGIAKAMTAYLDEKSTTEK